MTQVLQQINFKQRERGETCKLRDLMEIFFLNGQDEAIVSKNAHLGDKSIKKHKEVMKVRIVGQSERKGEGCDWDRTNGAAAGVAGKVLYLDLGGGYKGIGLIIIH